MENVLQFQNSVQCKLDDFQGVESLPTAGYTGISVKKENNLMIDWDMRVYSAKTQLPVQSTASTAITFDVMLYYSNMFQLTAGGDLVVIGQAGTI